MKMTRLEVWLCNRPKHAERAVHRAEELFPYVKVKEGQTFLEVGCGNGAVSKHIARKYHLNVTGIDVDPAQIKLAKKDIGDLPGIRFLACDAVNLPFLNEEFDIVLSFGTLHHILNYLDALGEIRRVLKPKGYFVYFDFIYPPAIARLGRAAHFRFGFNRFGMPTRQAIDSFTQSNSLVLVHSSWKNQLVWRQYKAVYQSR